MRRRISRGLSVRFDRIRNTLAFIRIQELMKHFHSDPDFPSSAGSPRQHLKQLVLGSTKSLDLLVEAVSVFGSASPVRQRKISETYPLDEKGSELTLILDKYGSDKGTFHGYAPLYSKLIGELGTSNLHILEIGLGTNQTDTLSNMGAHGIPGASLRAWRDFCAESNVVGCDIDERILFTEDRIRTFGLDQTSPASWKAFKSKISGIKFDLIIDDGLHSPIANLQTIIQSRELLSENGIIVIEDISTHSIQIWKVLSMLLSDDWKLELSVSNHANIGVLRRK